MKEEKPEFVKRFFRKLLGVNIGFAVLGVVLMIVLKKMYYILLCFPLIEDLMFIIVEAIWKKKNEKKQISKI